MRTFALLALLAVTLLACEKDPAADWKSVDLLEYGIPMTIMAPDSADINSSSLGPYKDVTIKKGDGYNVQILASDATTTDLSKLKSDQLETVKGNRYFKRIVSEEPSGFIYETAIDSSFINYGFRYVHVQGDQEFIFQTGMSGQFELEEVQRMYDAVKPAGSK